MKVSNTVYLLFIVLLSSRIVAFDPSPNLQRCYYYSADGWSVAGAAPPSDSFISSNTSTTTFDAAL